MSITPGKTEPTPLTSASNSHTSPNSSHASSGSHGGNDSHASSSSLSADDQMLLRMMRVMNTQLNNQQDTHPHAQTHHHSHHHPHHHMAPQAPTIGNTALMPVMPPCNLLNPVARTPVWAYPNRNHLSVTRLINPIYWINKILDHGRRMHCLSMGPNAYGSRCNTNMYPAPKYIPEEVFGKANSSAITSVPRTLFEIPRTAFEIVTDFVGTGARGVYDYRRAHEPTPQQMMHMLRSNPQLAYQVFPELMQNQQHPSPYVHDHEYMQKYFSHMYPTR